MNRVKISNQYIITGSEEIFLKPMIPFDGKICDFLDDLSKKLRQKPETKQYADILSFSFWCRKGNIEKLKHGFKSNGIRLGKGLAFHITPSNVPINFAFSFIFGLLSGNGNIVRVPSKSFPQVSIICEELEQLFQKDKYHDIKMQTAIISYEKERCEITDYFSSLCDIRIIWGGDATIREIRKSVLQTRCTDITFADRYSIGMIEAGAIQNASENEIKELADKFYNDTYLMDQNACSTPHLIFWKKNKNNEISASKKRFWDSVFQVARKYDLEDVKVSDKYTELCKLIIKCDNITINRRYENLLYIVELQVLNSNIEDYRGKYGIFYEYEISDVSEVFKYITNKIQTLAYYGINKERMGEYVLQHNLSGIDRIVPFGSTLDIGVIWDGYDIISQLSRIIEIK